MRKSLLLFIFASCLFNSCDDTFTNDIITTHPNNPHQVIVLLLIITLIGTV